MDAISNIDVKWSVAVLQFNGNASFSTALGSQSASGGDNYTIQYRGDVTNDRWQSAYHTNGNPASTSGASVILNTPAVVFHNDTSLTNFDLQVGGDRGIDGRGWDGYIAEVMYGNDTLTTGDREAIEGYFAHKWGTTAALPTDHTYKSVAPDLTVVPEPSSFLLRPAGRLLRSGVDHGPSKSLSLSKGRRAAKECSGNVWFTTIPVPSGTGIFYTLFN